MKKLMSLLTVGAFATLLGIAFAPVAAAQSASQQSTIVLTEPLDVGTVTLQPGTYLIKVVLIDSNRNMLQVSDPDQKKVFTTLLSRPHPILDNEVMPESRFVMWSAIPGQPRSLRTWYAHDRDTGHDIIYPKARALELAAATRESVIAIPDAVKETEYRTAPLLIVTPDRTAKPYVAAASPAPVAVAAARPATRMPKTASPVPLLGVLGLVSLGGALGLRALANRTA